MKSRSANCLGRGRASRWRPELAVSRVSKGAQLGARPRLPPGWRRRPRPPCARRGRAAPARPALHRPPRSHRERLRQSRNRRRRHDPVPIPATKVPWALPPIAMLPRPAASVRTRASDRRAAQRSPFPSTRLRSPARNVPAAFPPTRCCPAAGRDRRRRGRRRPGLGSAGTLALALDLDLGAETWHRGGTRPCGATATGQRARPMPAHQYQAVQSIRRSPIYHHRKRRILQYVWSSGKRPKCKPNELVVAGERRPQPRHAEGVEQRLVRNKGEALLQCLRDQHPVERALVRAGHGAGALGVADGDRQRDAAFGDFGRGVAATRPAAAACRSGTRRWSPRRSRR